MDHKGLVHLLKQKNLSGRQARWLEKISEFNFEVIYVAGAENILSDALSRLYSFDQPGTVHVRSEYAYHDIVNNDNLNDFLVSMPLLVGMKGENAILVAGMNLDPETSAELVLEGMSSQPKARRNRHKTIVEQAETGHPETSHEFATRTASHFALHGPQEHEEGKSPTETSMASQPDQQSTTKLTICLSARRKVASAAGETQAMSNDGSVGINKELYLSEKALLGLEQALDAQLTDRACEIAETIEPLPAVTLEELLAGG